MKYEAKNYGQLLGLPGLSDQLLNNHFTLYQGYVNNFNKLTDSLLQYSLDGKLETPEYGELTRRLGWEFNGMRLHEYYFDNIIKGGTSTTANSLLEKQITKDFGSYENWEKQFRAAGMIRGIGWVILCSDEKNEKLFNVWVNEHDMGHFAGTKPILVMDVFEHSYMLDYGIKRLGYIDTFINSIHWQEAEKRFEK